MTFLQPPPTQPEPGRWVPACDFKDLVPDQGVCALVRGEQVALFLVGEHVYALGNHDPFSGSNTISRGLIGSYTVGGETRLKVAAPLLKQAFDLLTGECLSDRTVKLPGYPVRVEGGAVWIGLVD